MIDDDSALEKEKEEMKKIDKKFEEKTQKLAQVIGIQLGGQEIPQSGMERGSKLVIDKETRIIDKAQARKTKTNEPGTSSYPFSVFNSIQSSHIVNMAQSCGIEM
jgi:hypothetical protein